MEGSNPNLARTISLLAALALLGYGLWALHTGRVITTWARMAYRPDPIYWVTVSAFLCLGAANLVYALCSPRSG
jgi:hypothetical protein